MKNQMKLNNYAYNWASLLDELDALTLSEFKRLTADVAALVDPESWKEAEFWALSQHNVKV